jgi:hypothetical protein
MNRGHATPPFDTVHALCRLASDRGWTLTELNRVWSFGYDPEHIASIIVNLPPTIHDCVQQASAFYCLSAIQTRKNKSVDDHTVAGTGRMSMSASACCAALTGSSSGPHPSSPGSSGAVAPATLGMTFDARTQMRNGYWPSPSMSRLLNMPVEVLNARLARHELALPFSDMDGVRIFLHLLVHELTIPGAPHVKYVRLCSRGGGGSLFPLVCWCSLSLVVAGLR